MCIDVWSRHNHPAVCPYRDGGDRQTVSPGRDTSEEAGHGVWAQAQVPAILTFLHQIMKSGRAIHQIRSARTYSTQCKLRREDIALGARKADSNVNPNGGPVPSAPVLYPAGPYDIPRRCLLLRGALLSMGDESHRPRWRLLWILKRRRRIILEIR